MCYLLDKARKDYNVVKELYRINDEMYLDICCYHICLLYTSPSPRD